MRALAHPSLAFVKYWGFLDEELFLPRNPSIGMALDGFYTVAEVEEADDDRFFLNGEELTGKKAMKPKKLMDFMRKRYDVKHYHVYTESNIPAGTGIASSSASMAAIAAAVLWEEGFDPSTEELSTIARIGSGSAARAVPGNYSEWLYGERHEDSYARVVFPKEHWDLRVVTLIISTEHKKVSSWEGHKLSNNFNEARIQRAWKNWWLARIALERRDLELLGKVVVEEMNGLMAAAISSGILYYSPKTIEVLNRLSDEEMLFPTMDAGPTVHIVTLPDRVGAAKALAEELDIPYVVSRCGEGVRRA